MAKRKNEKSGQPPSNEDKELKAIYDQYRREFSAADLQKYTEIEEGIPLEKVIAEMEEIHRKITQKRK